MKQRYINFISVLTSSIIATAVINAIFYLLENSDVTLKTTFISICSAAGAIKMNQLLKKYET
ncbi:hypothetical protein [Gayadomonas joobiniege]|uniref:hypothetical protein n=1 Tax=Gayadomonas joobiniege TaxID=1234606 RepID=UPI00036724A6|nr:hypothetical protein [Gayadomonas joobiniege]